ncbi:MAG TPA: APC family permease, partial [Kofleriaceae bacterium]|nr:APC family permease [Kofleriaceae bacterium]
MSTVEQQSSHLRKELGLTDLVLTQILYVVGLSWVGTAGKLGTSQIPFWLAAMALFYVPQAIVVVHLSRRFPLEGGLYQWAKLGLNPAIAFLVGWNLWIYAIVLLGVFGLSVSNALIYAIGPSAQWLSGNHLFIGAVSGGLLAGLMVVSVIGLRISKWVHNGGAVLLLLAFTLLVALPLINVARGTLREYHPLVVTAPALTLYSINIFSRLAVGGLSGFEYVAVLAGETRNAGRNIALSVMIAAPVIALMFILGTSAVQALTPIDQIDLIGPIPQALRNGLGGSGAAAFLIPAFVLAVTARTIGNSSLLLTATSRMPMVAGWDRLIPEWFSRLHATYRTPVNSVLFIGAFALAFAIAGTIGVGEQEAFQLLDSAAQILYALTYLVLFAIPLIGLARTGRRAPLWIRLIAGVGFATTALNIVLSVLPIVEVESWLVFGLKIGGTVAVANVIGAVLYVVRTRSGARGGGG